MACRRFAKESLSRIQYANPALDIRVNKPLKAKEDAWGPEMVLEFRSCNIYHLGTKNLFYILQKMVNLKPFTYMKNGLPQYYKK
jgi:hypothetical protein